ncbi:hypothetical protein JTE90_013434 [Oedothorax gibbosus]|uniref:UNC93-like protein n=1 Tax=Oedothorax gibbosus TaxID=931172 RepID=A0AAV6UEY4_9ARAC|nr:hypothetical protein JTE90_013434 [Oedothorax gibbosus]
MNFLGSVIHGLPYVNKFIGFDLKSITMEMKDYNNSKANGKASDSTKPPVLTQNRILKNLIVVCLGYLFLFSSYQGLANLQSTLNIEGNTGIISQSVIYVALIFSSLFLPKLIIRKLGCKVTLVLCILTYTPYIAANFYPSMATFVPTAILVGLGAAPLWSAKCTYLNEISALYAAQTSDTADVVTARFFGVFFMVFQNTQIWGNLVSYYVLKPNEGLLVSNSTSLLGSSSEMLSIATSNVSCGADFCFGINENLKPPPEDKRYMLTGIYLGLAVLGAIVVGAFLDPLQSQKKKDDAESTFSRVTATLKHLKNRDQMLLVPLTIFSGIEQAFILGDYTKAYVACAWGSYHVGLVFICFGVVNAVMSFFAGRLVKYVSRLFLVLFAAAANVGVCAVLYLWYPNSEQYSVFFVLVGVWGLSDAVWQTQINALYGVLFRSEAEAAFSNYRLWESVGFALAFCYGSFLCTVPKIAILLIFLSIGVAGYIVVEIRECRKKYSYDITKE